MHIKIVPLNCCVFRNVDFSMSSVWSAGLEDSASLRASDVRSPLPFAGQLHSTPNYWEDKLYNKQTIQATRPSSRLNTVGGPVSQVSFVACDFRFQTFWKISLLV
jgi:hypothetical protein